MSFFDSLGDPQTMALLGALAGVSQYAGASRLPQTFGQALGGGAEGLLAGIGQGQKYQMGQQQITGELMKNALALDQYRRQMAAMGQPQPTMADITSGHLPDWSAIFNQGATPSPGPGAPPAPSILQQMLPSASAAAGLPAVPDTSMGSPGIPAYSAPAAGVGGASYRALAATKANSLGIDPDFFTTQIHAESGFDPSAVGPATTGGGDAQERPLGIAQIKPTTASQWGVNPWDPDQALGGAANFVAGIVNGGGTYVKAAQEYGTIPHDLSKMDDNQRRVYEAAAAADQRAQYAQAGGGLTSTDATAGGLPQPTAGVGASPSSSYVPTMNPADAMRQFAITQARLGAIGGKIPDAAMNYYAAQTMSPGPARDLAIAQAMKSGGLDAIQNVRSNSSLLGLNPNNPFGPPKLLYQAPSLPQGMTLQQGPNGVQAVPVPGALQGAANLAGATAGAGAGARFPFTMAEKGLNLDPNGGVSAVPGHAPAQASIAGAAAGATTSAQNQANLGGLIPGGAFPGAGSAAPGPVAPQGAGAPSAPPITIPGIPAGTPVPLSLAQSNRTARTFYPIDTGRGTILPPLNQQAMPGSVKEIEAAIPKWTEKQTEWNASIAPAQAAQQRLGSIAQAFKMIQSGAWTTDKAAFDATMKSIGLPTTFTDPAQVEIALHSTVVQTLQGLKSYNPRFAQSEFKALVANSENPNLQPEAKLEMLAQDSATLARSLQLPRDWNDAQQIGWKNPLSFETNWTQANPLSNMVEYQRNAIGPLRGMPGGPSSPQLPQMGPAKIINGQTYQVIDGKWHLVQ